MTFCVIKGGPMCGRFELVIVGPHMLSLTLRLWALTLIVGIICKYVVYDQLSTNNILMGKCFKKVNIYLPTINFTGSGAKLVMNFVHWVDIFIRWLKYKLEGHSFHIHIPNTTNMRQQYKLIRPICCHR